MEKNLSLNTLKNLMKRYQIMPFAMTGKILNNAYTKTRRISTTKNFKNFQTFFPRHVAESFFSGKLELIICIVCLHFFVCALHISVLIV